MSDAVSPAKKPEKVVKTPKKKVAKTAPQHPKYADMIIAAIGALKERSGSSRQAILKYAQANYSVKDGANTHLKQALKRGVAAGTLKQVKGAGASGSFKVAEKAAKKVKKVKKPKAKKPVKKAAAAKKTPKKAAKKPAAKKPAAKKAKKPAAKKVAKKPAVKKPAAKKPAAKKVVKKAGKKAAPKKK